jgi:protein tyrosine phosphatase
MPRFPGLRTPHDLFCVMTAPALLGGMAYPIQGTPWAEISEAGFRSLVSLTETLPAYNPSPLQVAAAIELEDLDHGRPPQDSYREESLIRGVVTKVLGRYQQGDGILIHCAGGTGRTGTVLGCTLRVLGFDAHTVLTYLDQLNKTRGKHGWPESPWQADLVKRFSIQ